MYILSISNIYSMRQKTPVSLFVKKPVFFAYLKNPANQINCQCSHPRDHTLSNHYAHSPFAAQFSFNSCNCRNTGCIKKTEHKKACRCQRGNAVSYTHLDVYKRQVVTFPTRKGARTIKAVLITADKITRIRRRRYAFR